MIKAPIIIEGARIKGGEVEKLKKKYITTNSPWSQTMQWLKLFINIGKTLLKIPNPMPKLHPTHLFLSSLSSLSYNS